MRTRASSSLARGSGSLADRCCSTGSSPRCTRASRGKTVSLSPFGEAGLGSWPAALPHVGTKTAIGIAATGPSRRMLTSCRPGGKQPSAPHRIVCNQPSHVATALPGAATVLMRRPRAAERGSGHAACSVRCRDCSELDLVPPCATTAGAASRTPSDRNCGYSGEGSIVRQTGRRRSNDGPSPGAGARRQPRPRSPGARRGTPRTPA